MQQAEEVDPFFVRLAPCSRPEEKQHVSLLFCGDSDAGRTTVAKHLMFAFCGVSERSMEEQSASFPAFMVRQGEEPCRGVAISTAEFSTKTKHYTFSFAHHDFFKKVIARTLRVDLALLVVAADQK